MLLKDNSLNVLNLMKYFDDLNNVDKIRLAINILENKGFAINCNIDNIVIALKQVLAILDPNYINAIINLSKYINLVFLLAKNMELDYNDKRTNTERYTISKKQYIKDKLHLSELQDKDHKRLTDKGFDLERGIKNSDNVSINIKEYKKIIRKLNHNLNVRNDILNQTMTDLENRMKSNKETIFDKEFVKVKKDTFDSMNKVINETKKVIELQPKLQQIFKEVDSYTESYQSLQKQNTNIQKEIKYLKNKNNELQEENNNLKSYIKAILEAIKHLFRGLLQIGNKPTKEATTSEIKDYYDNQDFDMTDVIKIAKATTKEDELFDYVEAPSYLKSSKKTYKDKDDYEINW